MGRPGIIEHHRRQAPLGTLGVAAGHGMDVAQLLALMPDGNLIGAARRVAAQANWPPGPGHC